MSKMSVFGVLSLVGLALTLGCGSDDKKSSSSANGTAAVDACKAYCAADIAANCGFNADQAACESFETCSTFASVPATCADAVKAEYDCRKSVTDVCNAGTTCNPQGTAMIAACS